VWRCEFRELRRIPGDAHAHRSPIDGEPWVC